MKLRFQGALQISNGPETFDFNNITLANGNASASSVPFGGAIYFIDSFQGDDTLNISGSVFEGNSSELGGAINQVLGTVNIQDSTFVGNASTSSGGTRSPLGRSPMRRDC